MHLSSATSYTERPAFDLRHAVNAAYLAEYAYLPWSECRIQVGSSGFSKFQSFDAEHVQAYVAANDDSLVYVFAGTNEAADWRFNLDFRKVFINDSVEHGKCKVHNGFYEALNKIGFGMRLAIDKWHKPGMRITGVGHSLGAALATLQTWRHNVAGTTTYLFGSPRTGNTAFACEFNDRFPKTWNILHNNDAVGRVPLRSFGSYHVGQRIYVDWQDNLLYDPCICTRVFNQVMGRIDALWQRGILFDGFADHHVKKYRCKLEKCLKQQPLK